MLGRDNERPALPPDQGGAGPSVLEPVARDAASPQPRPARRRGAAADASGKRHLPRLDPCQGGHRRGRHATSTCGSSGTGRPRPTSTRSCLRASSSTRGSVAARSRAHMPVPAIASRSPSYLGKNDVFDGAIAEFAVAYADQNERDYDALVQAARDGRIRDQGGHLGALDGTAARPRWPLAPPHSASSCRCRQCSSSRTSVRYMTPSRAPSPFAVVGPPALADAVRDAFLAADDELRRRSRGAGVRSTVARRTARSSRAHRA